MCEHRISKNSNLGFAIKRATERQSEAFPRALTKYSLQTARAVYPRLWQNTLLTFDIRPSMQHPSSPLVRSPRLLCFVEAATKANYAFFFGR